MSRRKRAPPAPVDWDRLERIMRKSIRGEGMSEDEAKLAETAFWKDRDEYSRRHRIIKAEEFERERRKWSGEPEPD